MLGCWNSWNYLRVRGEYIFRTQVWSRYKELPPRARRIHFQIPSRTIDDGTTSACAENTSVLMPIFSWNWNYLRVRGEYFPRFLHDRAQLELPPRARRILQLCKGCVAFLGTTSACAENTFRPAPPPIPWRNYLRVRGEYPLRRKDFSMIFGTTSACAENTSPTLTCMFSTVELPPRARRIQFAHDLFQGQLGTTSACAENTSTCLAGGWGRGNYLRVRGEYSSIIS